MAAGVPPLLPAQTGGARLVAQALARRCPPRLPACIRARQSVAASNAATRCCKRACWLTLSKARLISPSCPRPRRAAVPVVGAAPAGRPPTNDPDGSTANRRPSSRLPGRGAAAPGVLDVGQLDWRAVGPDRGRRAAGGAASGPWSARYGCTAATQPRVRRSPTKQGSGSSTPRRPRTSKDASTFFVPVWATTLKTNLTTLLFSRGPACEE